MNLFLIFNLNLVFEFVYFCLIVVSALYLFISCVVVVVFVLLFQNQFLIITH